MNVHISDVWVAKLYPSNIIFFSLLIGGPVLAMVFRSIDCCHRFCGKMVRVPCTKRFWQFGELGMLIMVLSMLGLWTFYWLICHNYNGYWDGPSGAHNISVYERVARTLGQLGVAIMSLLMWPAARNSLVPIFFGTSWESAIQYHRWLGIAFLLVVTGHMIMNWIWQYQEGTLHILQVPTHITIGADNFTVKTLRLVPCLHLFALIYLIYYVTDSINDNRVLGIIIGIDPSSIRAITTQTVGIIQESSSFGLYHFDTICIMACCCFMVSLLRSFTSFQSQRLLMASYITMK
jgi:hypothetical protein